MTYKEFTIQYSLGTIDYDTLLDMANNKNTSKKILTILSKNKDSYVRSYVSSRDTKYSK